MFFSGKRNVQVAYVVTLIVVVNMVGLVVMVVSSSVIYRSPRSRSVRSIHGYGIQKGTSLILLHATLLKRGIFSHIFDSPRFFFQSAGNRREGGRGFV
jgi:hypothetical protein